MSSQDPASRSRLEQRWCEIENVAQTLKARGLFHCTAEDERLDGRCITLNGRSLVNFGSCSYLGLETDARLKVASCEAILRYGVQFSTSRSYVSAPLYAELEELLSRIVGGKPVVVTQTTSLGHLAALPVLIGERDAVLYDAFVHHSVQSVLPQLRQLGIPCEAVPHGRLDLVAERARSLAPAHQRVFFLTDGVFSMHGDILDTAELRRMLDDQPKLFAYVDDAHGVGWSGPNGRGVALRDDVIHERMVVVLGLAKGFASCGAAIVFPRAELAQRVFSCGGTLIFSGPLQPAQLGAGIAAARILLTPEAEQLQADVRERITLFDRLAQQRGLPVPAPGASPIRFIPVGREDVTLEFAVAMQRAGFYTNISVFPAVPRRAGGVRITLTRQQTLDDVHALVEAAGLALEHLGAPPATKLSA